MRHSTDTFGKLKISLVVLLAISFSALTAQAKYGGGTGEPNDPYLIYDANDLNTMSADSNDWDKHFKLIADIDLGGDAAALFSTIGSDYNPFGGVFDGNDHTIYNLPMRLFGRISGGQIENLGLTNPDTGLGSLAYRLHNGTISKCYVEGGSGLVAYNEGTITKCYSTGFCTGGTGIGGLVGKNGEEGIISECYSKSAVLGGNCVGGLVGENAGAIFNSYATGPVTKGYDYCVLFDGVGGLVGNNSGIIYNCYSTGSVSPIIDPVNGLCCVGGLVGSSYPYDPTGSFWDIQTSGLTTSDGGEGKTTAEMQTKSTFTDTGWDFVGETANGTEDIWYICERDDYPRLAWEEYGKYGGGTGEPNDPYLIYTSCQMNEIGADSNDWDKHFLLCADIDMGEFTGTEFNIIGTSLYDPFSGVFDGNGLTISNFTYTSTGTNYIGLFGYVFQGQIKDLGLIDPNLDVASGEYVSSLVGELRFGTITGCYVEGGSVSGDDTVGGLCGRSWISTINNCYSTASVSGDWLVGGIMGSISYGSMTNCYSSGDVSGDNFVGGLAGGNFGDTSDCYATGSVSGDDTVGGLVGGNGNLIFEGTITNCYSAGPVTGITNVGGLVGDNLVMVSNSFWDVNTSGLYYSAGGVGKTTFDMQTKSTFTDAGWDFVGETANGTEDIWTICEDHDYPRLSWEKYGGGNGTANKPYLICNPCQMNAIGTDLSDWDKHFLLCADIDLSGYVGEQFNIIGNSTTPFTGDFEGNGYKILNFTWTSVGRSTVGLFGCVGDGGLIKNVRMENADVDAGSRNYIGMLVGQNISGTVIDCYSTGSVQGESFVGGLAGKNDGLIADCYSKGSIGGVYFVGGLLGENHGLVANCYSTGNILGGGSVGGLIGENEDGTISKCYSTGSVSGNSTTGGLVGLSTSGTITNCFSKTNVHSFSTAASGIGGLVGEDASGTISNCYSTGLVEAVGLLARYIGGFVGIHASGTISNCYSSGSVSGFSLVGGLVGINDGVITDSFWDTDTSGLSNMCGAGSGCDDTKGKITSVMQTQSTFTDAGWDFVGETVNGTDDIWDICEGTNYPKFVWQIPPGDFLCPDGVNFFDYSFFAERWAEDNCGASNDCDGRDLDLLGSVDIKDLRIFVDNWLEGF